MTTEVVIVGAGGQGRECLDVAEAMIARGDDLVVLGFFDDDPSQENCARVTARGHDLLGGFADLLSAPSKLVVCIGIGAGQIRRALDRRLRLRGIDSPVLVHPAATVGSMVTLLPGAVVFAGARLTTNIHVGRHVHVNQNVTVGHDSVLDDYVTLNPQSAISGTVTIGEAATVGAGATVLEGRQVGSDAMVGASACVVRNVPAGAVVKGVPAR